MSYALAALLAYAAYGLLLALVMAGNPRLSAFRRVERLACDAIPGTVTGVTGHVTTASSSARQVEGLVIPWGRYGNTSAGRLAARTNSIRLPEDLSRVKYVDDHHRPPVVIGHAIAAWTTAEGLFMRFQLGRSERATAVLQSVEDQDKDGLSVELDDLVLDGDLINEGLLTAVAAVAVPAFTDARGRVAASTPNPTGDTMDPCTTCGHRHALTASCPSPALIAAPGATSPAPGTPQPQPQPQPLPGMTPQPGPGTPPQPQPQPTGPQPAEPQPQPQPTGPQPAEPQPQPTEPQQRNGGTSYTFHVAAPAPAAAAGSGPASAPTMLAGMVGQSGPQTQGATHDGEVYAALARVLTGTQRNPSLEAALSDIINTNVYDVVGQDSYVGRLWSGNTYTRRFVQLLRPGRLTSWRVKGWRWGVKPEVFDYAGDKADVPTNAPTVLPAETEAARLAGGHDLDRKFRDFGDTEFLQAYFEAMTESYAKKSDAKALAFILASATAAGATPAGANLIDAAVQAEGALQDALDDDAPADYVLVNRNDRRALLNITNNEAPAYAANLGFSWQKILPSGSVAPGTVVAGMKSAGTFYELGETPIRVEALDIARGGVDEAVFGYYATLLHDARGIQRVTVTP